MGQSKGSVSPVSGIGYCFFFGTMFDVFMKPFSMALVTWNPVNILLAPLVAIFALNSTNYDFQFNKVTEDGTFSDSSSRIFMD